MPYEIKVVGAKKAIRNLNSVSLHTADFGEAFDSIGEYFRRQVLDQFELRGTFPGARGPWKPLSPVTIALRGGSSRQLVHKHSLINAWTNPSSNFNIQDIHTHRARFGTSFRRRNNKGKIVPVAMFHQVGTRRMPDRPVVLGNKFMDVAIVDAFADQLFSTWMM